MEFLDPKIDAYVTNHTQQEPDVLHQLNRETNLNVLQPRMLSGHLQGRVLSMLSHMIQPKNILEVGTYTGYSAICMAEGMQEGGQLHTIDINSELEDMVLKYFAEAEVSNQIHLHIGSAIDIIPTIDTKFDMVFIDADKTNYSNYYDLVFDKVNKGGYIIADNVLWSGKVIENFESLDPDTQNLVQYSKKVHADDRVENVLFPIRDGLMIARKL
jgi:caffeoyl-CoA O-methyltransferase